MMLLMVTMLKMQVEVGDQEEKVALASRVRLQETFTKDVIETTKCQVIMMMMISPKKGHVSLPVLLKLDKSLSSSSHVSYIYFSLSHSVSF